MPKHTRMTDAGLLRMLTTRGGRRSKDAPQAHLTKVRHDVMKNREGWNAAQFGAWLAERVAKKHRMNTVAGRSEAVGKYKGGPAREKANLLKSVRRWVQRRTNGPVLQVSSADSRVRIHKEGEPRKAAVNMAPSPLAEQMGRADRQKNKQKRQAEGEGRADR